MILYNINNDKAIVKTDNEKEIYHGYLWQHLHLLNAKIS